MLEEIDEGGDQQPFREILAAQQRHQRHQPVAARLRSRHQRAQVAGVVQDSASVSSRYLGAKFSRAKRTPWESAQGLSVQPDGAGAPGKHREPFRSRPPRARFARWRRRSRRPPARYGTRRGNPAPAARSGCARSRRPRRARAPPRPLRASWRVWPAGRNRVSRQAQNKPAPDNEIEPGRKGQKREPDHLTIPICRNQSSASSSARV